MRILCGARALCLQQVNRPPANVQKKTCVRSSCCVRVHLRDEDSVAMLSLVSPFDAYSPSKV